MLTYCNITALTVIMLWKKQAVGSIEHDKGPSGLKKCGIFLG